MPIAKSRATAKVKSDIKNVIKIAIGEVRKRKQRRRRRKQPLAPSRPDKPSPRSGGGQTVFPSTLGNFLHGSSPSPLYPYQILLEQLRGRDKPRVEFLDAEKQTDSGISNLRLQLGEGLEELKDAQYEAEQRERERYAGLLRMTGQAFGMLQEQMRGSSARQPLILGGLEVREGEGRFLPPVERQPSLAGSQGSGALSQEGLERMRQSGSEIGETYESPRGSETGGEEPVISQEPVVEQSSPQTPRRTAPPVSPPTTEEGQPQSLLSRLTGGLFGTREQVPDQPSPQTTLTEGQMGMGGGGDVPQILYQKAIERGREMAQRGQTDVASVFEEESVASSQKGRRQKKIDQTQFGVILARDKTRILQNSLKMNEKSKVITSTIGNDQAQLQDKLFSKVPEETLNKLAPQFSTALKDKYKIYLSGKRYTQRQLKDLGL